MYGVIIVAAIIAGVAYWSKYEKAIKREQAEQLEYKKRIEHAKRRKAKPPKCKRRPKGQTGRKRGDK